MQYGQEAAEYSGLCLTNKHQGVANLYSRKTSSFFSYQNSSKEQAVCSHLALLAVLQISWVLFFFYTCACFRVGSSKKKQWWKDPIINSPFGKNQLQLRVCKVAIRKWKRAKADKTSWWVLHRQSLLTKILKKSNNKKGETKMSTNNS